MPAEYFATFDGPQNASKQCHILHDFDRKLSYCEDQTFWDIKDPEGNVIDRKVIATCDPNRKNWNTVMGPLKDPNPKGHLFLIDFTASSEKAKAITLENYPQAHDFHPLGIQIWPSIDGALSNMFVVNHGRHNTTIEQFSISPRKPNLATYIRTISSNALISPNALALTSQSSFFVSNDHYFTRRLPGIFGKVLPVLETFSGLPLGFISHVSISEHADGVEVSYDTPQANYPFPNGVALSPDGKTLAVASSSFTRVTLYTRTQDQDGKEKLTSPKNIPFPFAPDNIHFEHDGTLIVTGHSHFPSLVAVAAGKKDHAPSWVIALTPNANGTVISDSNTPFSVSRRVSEKAVHDAGYSLFTLYQGDGSKFGESTTGIRDSQTGTLFVTGLYQEGLLVCRSSY